MPALRDIGLSMRAPLRIALGLAMPVAALLVGTRLGWRRTLGPAASELPPALRFDYREEHDEGRAVAEVGVWLERCGEGEIELVLEPSALGPLVNPLPGYRGVRGGNERTALELERLLAGGLEVRTRASGGSAAGARPGTIGPSRIGRLPERHLEPDGEILRGESSPLVVAVRLGSGPLRQGTWTTEVLVSGRVRLAADFRFDGSRAEILGVHRDAQDHDPGEVSP
jgi:hypothetical protein